MTYVKFVHTRTGKEYKHTLEEFMDDPEGLQTVIDNLNEKYPPRDQIQDETDEEYEEYIISEYNVQIAGMINGDLKNTWNTYSETCLSPRGVIAPIFEIIEIVES